MPYNGLKGLGVGGHMRRIDGGDDNNFITDALCVPPIATDDSVDSKTPFFRLFKTTDDIRAYVAFGIAPADREDENGVFFIGAACSEPCCEDRIPALVVRAGCKLG